MGLSFSARLITSRRALAVSIATLALVAAGLVVGPRFDAKATILGTVSVSSPSGPEGNGGTGQSVTFSVQATGPVLSPETINYTTVDGTATAGDDYVAKQGTLTITNTTPQQVVVQLIGDTVIEPSETFKLQLSGGSSDDNSGTATIQNDDFGLSIDDISVNEGDTGTTNAVLTIKLGGGPRQSATTVQATTSDGTAREPSDYTKKLEVVTIPAGESQATISVAVKPEQLYEDNETFRVSLTNATEGVTIADGEAVVTIRNDDPVPSEEQQPRLVIGDAEFAEGNAGTSTGVFPVTLSFGVPYSVTVNAKTSAGPEPSASAPEDYSAFTSQTLTFAPGETSAQLPVTIASDTKDEFDERFTVTLSNPSVGAQIGDKDAVGTIKDDDPTPTISIANANANEGGKVTFTITLSAPSGRNTVMQVGTVDGTAKAGQDFTGLNGPTNLLTINAGDTTKTVQVDTLPDSLHEAAETFQLSVKQATNPESTEFGPAVLATGTINDTNSPPGLSISDVSKDEGNSGTTTFDFTVTLTPKSGQTVKVKYTVGADSGPNAVPATPTTDFAPATGDLTFAPDETTKTISVAVVGDTFGEDNETFRVTLSSPENTTLSDGVGIGTIKNDDGTFIRAGAITTGAGAGGGSHVRFFSADNQAQGPGFFATVNGPGVRVARGDLDGDGHDEVIASSGPGGPSFVRVFNSDGSGLVAEVEAYPGFNGGVSVAAADIDGDGKDEIVTGALAGGGPHVRTFDMTGEPGNRSLVGTPGFFGSQRAHTGGINVAAADTDGDGKAEIITAIASGGSPAIGVFKYNPTTNQASLVSDAFLAFDERFLGGVNIAAGDLNGDGKAEIVAGAGPGAAPHIRAFSPSGGGYEFSLYAYGTDFPGGVQVAIGDINGDGKNEVVTGVGAGGGPHVRAFDFLTKDPLSTSFYAYDAGWSGGVNVAVGTP